MKDGVAAERLPKWIRGFEFREMNGYHLRSDPWNEERCAAQETDAMQRMRMEARRRGTP